MNTKIQVLRGLAIIAVVMIHTCPSGYAQVWIRPFINWAVPLFLFLSGYLTKMENDNWSSLIRKRVLKVMIPYLLWTLIYTIPNFTPTRFLFNLVSAKGAITLYFIFVYVQMVLLTPAFSKISKPKFGWILFGTVPLLLYASKGITPPPQAQPMLAWIWKTSFLLWYPYYLLGLWLGNHVIKSKMALTVLILLSVVKHRSAEKQEFMIMHRSSIMIKSEEAPGFVVTAWFLVKHRSAANQKLEIIHSVYFSYIYLF